jgi:hypothetical protein
MQLPEYNGAEEAMQSEVRKLMTSLSNLKMN